MADNISIKIEDEIPSSIPSKLKQIAQEARNADAAIKNLQAQLSNVSGSAALARLQTAMNNAETSTQRLAKATSDAGTAALKAATQSQRLATETERTEAAASRAAIAALRLSQAQAKVAGSTGSMEREAEKLRQSLNPLYAAQVQYDNEVKRALELYKAGAISVKTYTDAVNRSGEQFQAAKTGAAALESGLVKVGNGAKVGRQHLANLGFQLNDIGVSLASGQNPLTVFIQQGAQIGQIAAQAGVSLGAMARAAAGLLLPFAPLVAALGVGAMAFKGFQDEAAKDAGLKEFAKNLGATNKEIKKMQLDTITFGDTMKGLWETIFPKDAAANLLKNVKEVSINIVKFFALAMSSIVALFQATADTLVEVWRSFPTGFKKPIVEAINAATGYFETFINFAIDGLNLVLSAMSEAAGTKFEPFKNVKFDKISTEFAAASGKSFGETWLNGYATHLKNNQDKLKAFTDQVAKNSVKAAKNRIKEALSDKKGKKDTLEETRASMLAKVNAQLDDEAARMFKVVQLREVDAKLDQIKERFIGKGRPLDDNEIAALRAKIEANQKALAVQKEFDAIINDAQGPLIQYSNRIQGINKALEANQISQDQAAGAIAKATDELERSLNPMFEFQRAGEEQNKLLAVTVDQREAEAQIIQLTNTLKAAGVANAEAEARAMSDEIKQRIEKNKVLAIEAQLYENLGVNRQKNAAREVEAFRGLPGATAGDTGAFANKQLSEMGIDTTGFQSTLDMQLEAYQLYAEQLIELNREVNGQKLLSDQDYANASMQLEMQRQNLFLDQYKNFFGGLSTLQNSGNKKLATVGKAAAIAQATISTYQAAVGAYASASAIPGVGWLLAPVAAGAAIAAGLANVAQIKSTNVSGFRSGGYTGGMGLNEIAGVVHGQEFVMNAASTSRIGLANLEALQRGAAVVQGGPSSSTTNTSYDNSRSSKVVNQNINVNGAAGDKRTPHQLARALKKHTEKQLGD